MAKNRNINIALRACEWKDTTNTVRSRLATLCLRDGVMAGIARQGTPYNWPTSPSAKLVMAYSGGIIVGWAAVRRYRNTSRTAYLDVYVGRAWQNMGIGSRLVKHAIGVARQMQGVTKINTEAFDGRGGHLYAKHGFINNYLDLRQEICAPKKGRGQEGSL